MAKIPLTEGFSPLPEGTYVFRVDKVDYKEAFGKLVITLVTQSGKKHAERFYLQNKDGGDNDGARSAFSFLAKTALNDFTATEIDPEDLLGYFIKAEISHEDTDGRTYARLGQKWPADGFEDDGTDEKEPATVQKAADSDFDLDDLLGA